MERENPKNSKHNTSFIFEGILRNASGNMFHTARKILRCPLNVRINGPRACLDVFGGGKSSLPDPIAVNMKNKITALFKY
jgi:hypothetical protein